MTQLTDRSALLSHRARCLRAGPEDFLHRLAIEELQDRLAIVNKSFTDIAVVGGWMPCWAEAFPTARHVPDDPVLALEPESCDLILHVMSLHWAEDPVGQLVQARRALRPDGLLLAIAPGGRSLQELRATLAEAEIAVTGGLSPRILPMAEIRDLGGLLGRAGLAMPVADSVPLTLKYRSALHLMEDLRKMGEGNALSDRRRTPPPRALFADTARRYAAAFADAQGRVSATFELIVLTGWAPDASQPKPLRPGSAAARLADALNTQETPLGEHPAPAPESFRLPTGKPGPGGSKD